MMALMMVTMVDEEMFKMAIKTQPIEILTKKQGNRSSSEPLSMVSKLNDYTFK